MLKIIVAQVTGLYCGTSREGDALYEQISQPLREGQQVELDFTGVQLTSSTFFNVLYGRITQELGNPQTDGLIKMVGMMPRHQFVLSRIREPNPA